VVAAAAELTDEVGWEQLTLAQLAARLGVRLPSLYKHIESLDGLRRDVAVLAVNELAVALGTAAIGRAGRHALQALAAAYRDYGRRHPGRYAATVRAPAADDAEHTAAADAVLHVVLAVLDGYQLTGDDAIDATRALRAAMHGFVSLEASGGFGLPADVDRSYSRLVDGLDASLYRWAGPEQRAGDAGH
jgi:AcrR family transcriptional regulator